MEGRRVMRARRRAVRQPRAETSDPASSVPGSPVSNGGSPVSDGGSSSSNGGSSASNGSSLRTAWYNAGTVLADPVPASRFPGSSAPPAPVALDAGDTGSGPAPRVPDGRRTGSDPFGWRGGSGPRRAVIVAVPLALLLVIAAGLVWYRGRAPSVVTAVAAAGSFTGSTGGIGTVGTLPDSTFAVTGSQFFPIGPIAVSGVDVLAGETVRQGQKLVTLDGSAVHGAIATLEAQVAVDRHELGVIDTGSISAQDLETEAQIRSEVALLGDEVQLARGNSAVITSPVAGRVVAVGATVGSLVQGGKPLVEIAQIHQLSVSFGVPLTDMQFVGQGDRAVVTFPGLPSVTEDGTVAAIDPRASNGGVDGTVIAAFPNLSDELIPIGAEANVSIQEPVRSPVVVPAVAVVDAELAPEVFVVRNGRVELRRVTIGPSDGQSTQVISGLRAGERVAVSNLQMLEPGMRVEDAH